MSAALIELDCKGSCASWTQLAVVTTSSALRYFVLFAVHRSEILISDNQNRSAFSAGSSHRCIRSSYLTNS